MAKNKFSLDFKGFLDLASEISEKYGDEWLLYATEQALDKSKIEVNVEIKKAMDSSRYHFNGGGYSKGKAMDSLMKVNDMPVEVNGTEVKAFIGVDLEEAPEAMMLALGTPHLGADKQLYNALKVKGRIRKKVDMIQSEVFHKVLNGDTIR